MYFLSGCARPRSLRLCLPPELVEHLTRHGLQCPSRQALQRSRIEMDLASMIYSKRFVLNASHSFWLHLRVDSSPQGGRDFFVSEFDLVKFQCSPGDFETGSTGSDHITQLLSSGKMKLTTRLLPLAIVGARAGSSVHKGRLLLRSLQLDSEDLRVSIGRTMTMMFDFGAEAGPSCRKIALLLSVHQFMSIIDYI